jgi:hypothetical protein
MEPTYIDCDELRRLEEELWREEMRFDPARMEQLLAADFVEFGCSGRVYQRCDILCAKREAIAARFPLAELRARLVGADTVLITYNSSAKYHEKYRHCRRSSIWTRASTGWVLRFHQGTRFGGED